MLYVYLFRRHAFWLPFYRILSFFGKSYVGTSNCIMCTYHTINYSNFLSNCFMSTYFTDMLLVYIFHRILFYSWYILFRNVLLLNVYLFHGHASCLHFSRNTIFCSDTLYERLIALYLLISRKTISLSAALYVGLSTFFSVYNYTFWNSYVGTSYCFMPTYFIDMHLVYLFHGIQFYFLVHYMYL